MAVSSHHADRLLPSLMEIIESEARLDEVEWSLTPALVAADQGNQVLTWQFILSSASPILGQGSITCPVYMPFEVKDAEFRANVIEMLNQIVQVRASLMMVQPGEGPNGHPLLGG